MDSPKFKVGDYITIKENPQDQAIQRGIQGYYKVLKVYADGYDLYSVKKDEIRTRDELTVWFESAREDFLDFGDPEETLKRYPVHPGQYPTLLKLFDTSYRLLTPAEVTLYAKK
jgi:starvation-inducible outer membrane lipoprotein